jgi:hypothetical protein
VKIGFKFKKVRSNIHVSGEDREKICILRALLKPKPVPPSEWTDPYADRAIFPDDLIIITG